MPTLVLINGAPGSGKSTVADALARRPGAVAVDVDAIKHALPSWPRDDFEAGLESRRLALVEIRGHLRAGRDVFVGQYLARTDFVEQLEQAARQESAAFVEILLVLPQDALAERLASRRAAPTRPEHEVNGPLAGPEDAELLLASLDDIADRRPRTVRIDALGDVADVADRVRRLLPGPDPR